MSVCHRCGDETNATIMSKFNRDILCMPCKQDELTAPGYREADEAEVSAVRAGQLNFRGIGLSYFDIAYLAAKVAARRKL